MTEPKVDRAPCLCGCGGTPKGKKSRFIPGHDARYHAAQKRATIIEQAPPVESEDGIIREFTRGKLSRDSGPCQGPGCAPGPLSAPRCQESVS